MLQLPDGTQLRRFKVALALEINYYGRLDDTPLALCGQIMKLTLI
jgi:hypothetical protein